MLMLPTAIGVSYAQVEAGLAEYVNERFGIAFSYPDDWVFDDYTAKWSQSVYMQAEEMLGYGFIGYLCPEENSIPALGSDAGCDASEEIVGFIRYTEIDQKIAERTGEAATQATAEDVFAYYAEVQLADDDPESTIDDTMSVDELVSNTPITVDIVDSATGAVTGEAEGVLMEFTYTAEEVPFSPTFRAYQVFIINGGTGYSFGIEGTDDEIPSEETPEILQSVVDTFRFVV